MMFSEDFVRAARDYRLLLDRGYPLAASLKLVGDRYRLGKTERMVLFRGIMPGDVSVRNATRLVSTLPAGSRIAIDGYNVLFTVMNYLRGHPLFISTDGFLRDAGGAHGRVADSSQFLDVASRLCETLARLAVAYAAIYIDEPVSRSASHALALRGLLAARGIEGEVFLVHSADGPVASWEGDAIATSDSGIVCRARAPVFDLARYLLETRYEASLPELAPIACL